MKLFISIAIILISFSCSNPTPEDTADTQAVLSVADPVEYGLEVSELEAISDHIQMAIDSQYISGAVAMIAKGDRVIFYESYGYSDRDKTEPMDRDAIFRLASMTKPITSTAIMQLVEKDLIGLQDPVSKYIPEFANMMVIQNFNKADSSYETIPVQNEMTIHHLLTHTAGFAYGLFDPVAGAAYADFGITEAWTEDSVTLAMNIPRFGHLPLMHEPGEAFTYGVNIDVLGYIVELVSDMPLDEYFEENIFKPLGMDDTYFYLPADKADRLVEVWFTEDAGNFPTDYPVQGAKTYFAGGAGLVGTAEDYIRFASALLNMGTLGDVQILKPETVELMFKNQIDQIRLGEGEGFGYGGMVRLQEDGDGRNVGYWGWDGFWQTRFRLDPENDMVLVLMTNTFPPPRLDVLGEYGKLVVKGIEN
jgi:CubicO group peptidase (beta-lactamase class C family)